MAKTGNAKKGSKKIIWIAAAVAVIAAGIGGWLYLSGRPVDLMALYPTETAAPGTVSRTIAGEGTVQERETISLFINRSQKVSKVLIDEGDTVAEGQVLVEYDVADDLLELNRQLSEARLYLQNARLSLQTIAQPPGGNSLIQYEGEVTSAQKSVDDTLAEIESLNSQIIQQGLRAQNLRKIASDYRKEYSDGYMGEEEYQTARTNYRVAEEVLEELRLLLESKENTLAVREQQLDDAKRKLENAMDPLSDPLTASKYQIQENLVSIHALTVERLENDISKITAETLCPMDGVVLNVGVTEGGTASAYSPILELADLSRPVIRFEAGEYDAPLIEASQNVRVTFGGMSDMTLDGEVTKLGVRAVKKEASGSDEIIVPVEITLKDGGETLRVGNTVGVEIVLEERRDVLAVPIRAVMPVDGESCLLLIENDAVVLRPVTAGLYGDRYIEITDGLAPGEVYILSPADVDPALYR